MLFYLTMNSSTITYFMIKMKIMENIITFHISIIFFLYDRG